MDIGVIGLGYVGLIQSIGLADLGFNIVGIDIDKNKVEKLNKGEVAIYEDGLEELLKRNLNKLKFTNSYKKIKECKVIFICVGTPQDKEGRADLKYVFSAANLIRDNLGEDYKIIVIKSTAPVGTNKKVKEILNDKHVDIVSNPEFLREGSALKDFFNPDRIVLGFENEKKEKAKEVMLQIYKSFKDKGVPFLITNWKTAEMIKYASNAFLATKISFINEIGNICKKLGINVYDVAKGMGYDKRICRTFLNAGIGFGGSCFPKDVKALINTAKEVGEEVSILEKVIELNEKQPLKLLEIIGKKGISFKNKKIAILGLTFKPDTDDIRESRAIPLIKKLLEEKAIIHANDPMGVKNMKQLFPENENLKYTANPQKAVDESEIILLLTEWPHFKELDFGDKLVIDGRNSISEEKRKNLNYEGVCW